MWYFVARASMGEVLPGGRWECECHRVDIIDAYQDSSERVERMIGRLWVRLDELLGKDGRREVSDALSLFISLASVRRQVMYCPVPHGGDSGDIWTRADRP